MNEPRENNSPAAPQDDGRPLSLSDRVRSLRLPDRGGRPSGFSWVPWILCLFLAGSTLFFALRSTGPSEADKDAEARKASPGQGPARGEIQGDIALEAKGYLMPVDFVRVSPKVNAMILKVHFEEGMRVKKNDPLAELETKDFEYDKQRAKALVDAAEHRLAELTKYRPKETRQVLVELEDAKVQRDRLVQDWKRTVDLKGNQAVAARDYEEAWASLKSMDYKVERLQLAWELLDKEGPRDARIATVNEELNQAKADLAKAEWRLENCQVKAPADGIILTKNAKIGAMANPNAFSTEGLPSGLCDIADLTKLEVDIAIAERDISKVFKDQKCKVRAEAFPDRVYHGVVWRLMPIADRSKGAVPVRVRLTVPREEEGQYLRPDMGAIVTFLGKK